MKTALVTGGSRGIGRAICIKLATSGYYILVNYKSNVQEAETTLSQIMETGGNGELLQMDVSDRSQIKQILGNWLTTNPEKQVEILVNNAGEKDDSLMVWMNDEQWDHVLKTSLDGFFFVTRLVLDSMLLNRYGRDRK